MHIIVRRRILHPLKAALRAVMQNAVVRRRSFEPHGFHHAKAYSRPIAWRDIDMLAPQAVRAMVGVSGADHFRAAVFADEIFYAFLECAHGVLVAAVVVVGAVGGRTGSGCADVSSSGASPCGTSGR